MFITFRHSDTNYVKATLDNNNYIIQKGNQYMMLESANALAEINTRIQKLKEHLNNKYSNDKTKIYFIKYLNNFNYSSLSEAVIDKRYTTYTIDKKNMHVCLRTRDNKQKLYDINLLMYVILHEIAHYCNYNRDDKPIVGHGIEFKNIFKFLVTESIDINIYKYDDYSQSPQEYCGIIVNTNIM